MPVHRMPVIECNDIESRVLALLQRVGELHNLVVRVAGGWVRDKVLGLPSKYDLDIVIDGCTGETFAGYVNEVLRADGHDESKVGIIKANPAKSKHLETATMKLWGLELDFCHLRAEEYAKDSRIPSTTFGTPLQDALRRDLTINALFYNLHSREVEDFCGQGLHDLQCGIARTPLDPLVTFHDDPLRTLRTIRFAARFELVIDDETMAAMSTPTVKTALDLKVSRERINKEISKFLASNPILGMHFLVRSGLFDSVFNVSDPLDAEAAMERIRQIPSMRFCDSSHFDEDMDALVTSLAVILAPTKGRHWDSKGKSFSFVFLIQSLKYSKRVAHAVSLMVEHAGPVAVDRVSVGQFVRKCEGYYGTCLRVAVACGLILLREAIYIADFVKSQNLSEAHLLRPLLSGKDLAAEFEARPGPWMAVALSRLIDLQLASPDMSSDDAIGELRSLRDSGGLLIP